jgi:hypothetical protein
MNRDDIIRLAREAGFDVEVQDMFNYKPQHSFIGSDENMIRFAELVVGKLVSDIEVDACDFYFNETNNYGSITVKYFVSGDPIRMRGEEVDGTGRYRLNKEFVQSLIRIEP